MANAYWDNNGTEQSKYDEMVAVGFEFTQASEKVFHSYYRYYNDGDLPGWARGKYNLRKWSGLYGQYVLNENGEQELEDRVTEVVMKEWKRFQKATTSCG